MALLGSVAIISIPIFETVFNLMPSLLFVGSLGFVLSTIIRNGNGTAVAMVVLGVIALIASDMLSDSMWNVFMNPYDKPNWMNEVLWDELVFKNRVFLLVSSISFVLIALLNLQKREKFLG